MRIPKDIDDYLSWVPADRRATLEVVRARIHELLPKAIECISYGMPAFRVEGGVFAGFVATRNGCSYFPFSGRTLTTLAKDVAKFSQTKGALHFDGDVPLSKALLKKLIAARLREIEERSSAKVRTSRKP
ncbi:MAG: DUF1801 domain-containing protein [Deltaproteobacteria bacterium]|nr:DUF1801 domain-containing protein [Deltaproteobacteria bacterium]